MGQAQGGGKEGQEMHKTLHPALPTLMYSPRGTAFAPIVTGLKPSSK